MIAILDPLANRRRKVGRRPCPRCGSTTRICYVADESIPDPKGRESWTPQPFPLQNSPFWGPHEGAIVAILDPLANRRRKVGRRPCPRCGSTTRIC
jgi:hypothetical protein